MNEETEAELGPGGRSESEEGKVQPPANGGRTSTVSPGWTSTDAGSALPTGRLPTSTEQAESTAGRRSACAKRRTTSARTHATDTAPGTSTSSSPVPAAARAPAQR